MKKTHGGKRKGAGRKKSAPNTVKSVTIKKALIDRLNAKYSSRKITIIIKEFLKLLDNSKAKIVFNNHDYCPYCGWKKEYKVFTDINSEKVCKNSLCDDNLNY